MVICKHLVIPAVSLYNRFMNIAPKEYMSSRNLIDYTVPADTDTIGEWAFARCRNLRSIYIPAGCSVANRAFEDCPSLSEVRIYDRSPETVINHHPHLLALALRTWDKDATRLFTQAADDTRLTEYIDARLGQYLSIPDDDGFSPFLAGGEEDYDNTAALSRHVRNTGQRKVELIYERMCSGIPIADETRKIYNDTLIGYNPDITFGILTPPTAYNSTYRDLYFEMRLNEYVEPEVLLGIAADDTSLRAMVLGHSCGHAGSIDSMIL